ncbi:hypothetical protein ACO0LV_04430 [Pseudactinotalea sp. Z1739]|uniref:hypothetical protein n=1 Tax=Pseudactinotalea sp. Z1739 TaxID=3413028 RepID=UPI003C7C87F8
MAAWFTYAETRGRWRQQILRVYGSASGRLSPAIGPLSLHEVTPRAIPDAIDALHEVRPGQVKNASAVLRQALSYVVREGAIQVNPARELEPPAGRSRGEVRALTPDEEVLLLRLVREHRTDRDPRRPMVRGPRPTSLRPNGRLCCRSQSDRFSRWLARR